jgi:hypothetical protein
LSLGGLHSDGHHGFALGSGAVMNSDELNNVFSPSPRATPATQSKARPSNGRDTEALTQQAMHIHYNTEYQPDYAASQGQYYDTERHVQNGELIYMYCLAARRVPSRPGYYSWM